MYNNKLAFSITPSQVVPSLYCIAPSWKKNISLESASRKTAKSHKFHMNKFLPFFPHPRDGWNSAQEDTNTQPKTHLRPMFTADRLLPDPRCPMRVGHKHWKGNIYQCLQDFVILNQNDHTFCRFRPRYHQNVHSAIIESNCICGVFFKSCDAQECFEILTKHYYK